MHCRLCGIPVANGRSTESAQFCSPEHQQLHEAGEKLELPLDETEVLTEIRMGSWGRDPLFEEAMETLSLLGIYPHPFFPLRPLGELEGPKRYVKSSRPPRYPFRKAVNRAPVVESKRFPSGGPKGFTSEMPMSRLQPSFRTLTGDVLMAGTSPTKPRQSGTNIHAGPPNLHRAAVRQVALQMAEKRWSQVALPRLSVETLDFTPPVEWRNTARLNFDATGFNFQGDPQPNKPGRLLPDVVVNVRSALLEPESAAPHQPRPIRFEPIVWDEIEQVAASSVEGAIPALARTLELFEPPVVVKPAAKPVSPPKVEEEPINPPPLCETVSIDRPQVRKGPPPAPATLPEPLAASGSRIHLPVISIAPLRNPIVLGPSPAPNPIAVRLVPEVDVNVAEVKLAEAKQETKAESKPEAKPATESKSSATPSAHGRKRKKQHRQNGRTEHDDPVEEPEELGEDVEAEILAANHTPADNPKPDIESKSTPEPEKKSAPAPAEKDREVESKKVESEKEGAGKPEANKPESASPPPEVHFGGLAHLPAPAPRSASLGLGLSTPESELITPVTGMGIGMKIGIAVGVLAVVGGIAFAIFGGSTPAKPIQAAAGGGGVVLQTAGIVTGEAGWMTDYSSDDKGARLRQLSYYRPSMLVNDYRVEFQAEIEYKAVSWVVRGSNNKSHYVLKLVQDRSGGSAALKLQRFPVVDNKQGEVVEKELRLPSTLGTVYRVRTDVVGNRYRITINDKQVDEWTYAQLASGGFGVANEGAERGQIRAIQMWHLQERPAPK